MDWKSVGEKVKTGGSDFYRLEQGMNRLRIVSGVEERGTHFASSQKKSFSCQGKDTCEYCKAGDKVKMKFLMYVIDRRDNQVKLAEFGYSIVREVAKLQKDEDYAFAEYPDYDLKITKSGEGMNTEYTVTPAPNKSPLTAQEAADVAKQTPLHEVAERLRSNKNVSRGTITNSGELITEEDIAF